MEQNYTEDLVTFNELAYSAIAKHSHQVFKYRVRVLEDKDPEDLHQMRIEIRRLRSAISGFAVGVDLPETITETNIAKISRSLGKLRDLDVLLAVLQDEYQPLLPIDEQIKLDKAVELIKRQRKHKLKQVRKTLNGKLYFKLRRELENWLDVPTHHKMGRCSVYLLLPDLLLTQVSQLLLHPGWTVGVNIKKGRVQFPPILDREAIAEILSREDVLLHGLRKSAKKTRYGLELFAQFYDDTFHQYLDRIRQIQEILGQFQDAHLLQKTLAKALKSEVSEQMPQLAQLLLKTRYQRWLEWQILQKQFLNKRIRKRIKQIILQI